MLTLIYTEDDHPMILTKEEFENYDALQRQYPIAIASLRFKCIEDLVGFFEDDLGMNDAKWPYSRAQLEAFVASADLKLHSR